MKKTPRQLLSLTLWYFTCLVLALVVCWAFYVDAFPVRFKPAAEIFTNPPVLISANFSFDNYRDVFARTPFWTIYVEFFCSCGNRDDYCPLAACDGRLCVSAPGISGSQRDIIGIISTLMIPFYTIMIPLAILIKQLNWINTYFALIIPAIPHAFWYFLAAAILLGNSTRAGRCARWMAPPA